MIVCYIVFLCCRAELGKSIVISRLTFKYFFDMVGRTRPVTSTVTLMEKALCYPLHEERRVAQTG